MSDSELSFGFDDGSVGLADDEVFDAVPAVVAAPLPLPPTDPEELLAEAGPRRRAIFDVARQIADELDAAAPWDQLYDPPTSPTGFLAMEVDFLEVLDAIPARISERLEAIAASEADESRQIYEDAEFYFSGIHYMVTADLDRLRRRVEVQMMDPTAALAPFDRNFVCELMGDLKGKYSSALMGAAASLVAEGRWDGIEVEPVLFAEKAAEFDRNEHLLTDLELVLSTLGSLMSEAPFPELRHAWRDGARADQYALADLSTLRGVLGRLLQRSSRRALYSGDYHQIQRREMRLSRRINELDALHHRLWLEDLADDERAPTFERMAGLVLEIVAVLDTALLEELIGAAAVKDIRVVVMAEKEKLDDTSIGVEPAGPDDRLRQRLDPELRPLVPLLYEDDLKTLFDFLIGSVAKRASFAVTRRRAERAQAEEERLASEASETPSPAIPSQPDPTTEVEIEEETPLLDPLPKSVEESVAPAQAQVEAPQPKEEPSEQVEEAPPTKAAAPAKTQTMAKPAVTVPVEEQLEVLVALKTQLDSIMSPNHPLRKDFLMLERLLGRNLRVPSSMLASCEPYFYELLNTLVPLLERAVLFGAVPNEARQRLVQYSMALVAAKSSPEALDTQVPGIMKRLERLLSALQLAVADPERAVRSPT